MLRLRELPISRGGSGPFTGQTWFWWVCAILVAMAVFILPIAWSIRFSAQSAWWWDRGFTANSVEARTGLSRTEVDRVAKELRIYFQSEDRFVSISVTELEGAEEPLFSEREILHLVDVKQLLERTYDAGWAALGFLLMIPALIWYTHRRETARAIACLGVLAGTTSAATIIAIGMISIIGFDEVFRQFHLLFFTNDLWQLSSHDRLIQLFPQRFFFETTMLVGGVTLTLGAALAAGGWICLRHTSGIFWSNAP